MDLLFNSSEYVSTSVIGFFVVVRLCFFLQCSICICQTYCVCCVSVAKKNTVLIGLEFWQQTIFICIVNWIK